ncbi:MAG: transcriptional repressor [Candidatus Magasanikbacteria bacterium]
MAKTSKKKTNWLTDTLNNLGLNKSTVREQICREIYLQKGIFSANQIIERIGLGKVSVYRNLELLEKLNLIRPAITVRGQRFYEKNNNANHHHHIICTECLKTSCIDCAEPKIKSKEKFQNINHLLIFTGICNTCVKSN